MLDPLASPRSPGFKWDGSGYASTRGQATDEDSSLQHTVALELLLLIAPTGFPAHKPLTSTFLELDYVDSGRARLPSRVLGADRGKALNFWRSFMSRPCNRDVMENHPVVGGLDLEAHFTQSRGPLRIPLPATAYLRLVREAFGGGDQDALWWRHTSLLWARGSSAAKTLRAILKALCGGREGK